MTAFTRRRIVATLFAGVLAATLAPAPEAEARSYGHGHGGARYLQVYSFQYVDSARSKARSLRRHGFDKANVYKTSNGWYAVTAGKVWRGQEHVVDRLKWKGAIPQDSFLTEGTRYLHEVSLHRGHGHPRPQGHGHRPLPRKRAYGY